MNSLKIYLYAFISMSLWAFSFVWYKDAFISYGPVTVIFMRLLISITILFFLIVVKKIKILPAKSDFKYLFLISFFEPFCYFIGESFGMQHVSPTTGAIIISTIPLLTPLFLFIMGIKEKIGFTNILGIIISFTGIVFVVSSGGASFTASGKGVSLLFLAVVSAIFFSITLKKIGGKYNSILIVFWQNLIAVSLFLPMFLVFEFNSFINAAPNLAAISAILKLGAFPSTVSFILFIPVVTQLGASKANTFTNLIPIITAVFSFFFFGEEFTSIKIIGIIAVIAGLFVSQINFTNKKIQGATI